jgi:cytochrome c oxidase cbb3-type subunit 3
MQANRAFDLAIVLLASIVCGSCREQTAVRSSSTAAALVEGNRQSELQPGRPAPFAIANNPFEGQEEAIAEGKRLYNQYNCSGCHAAGGGAIGPPLMDDEWIYGSSSANIFWTIVEGRPQGMPAFGGRIATDEVWRIAAFVRSLSGLEKQDQASEKRY